MTHWQLETLTSPSIIPIHYLSPCQHGKLPSAALKIEKKPQHTAVQPLWSQRTTLFLALHRTSPSPPSPTTASNQATQQTAKTNRQTYHRRLQPPPILGQQPNRLTDGTCPLNQPLCLAITDILPDAPDLIARGRALGDVQLELGALQPVLRRVVRGLVLGGGLGGLRGKLLEEGEGACGGRERGPVEDGDYVAGGGALGLKRDQPGLGLAWESEGGGCRGKGRGGSYPTEHDCGERRERRFWGGTCGNWVLWRSLKRDERNLELYIHKYRDLTVNSSWIRYSQRHVCTNEVGDTNADGGRGCVILHCQERPPIREIP